MADDSAQPTGTGSGQPPDLHRETPAIRALQAAVSELQTHRTYMEQHLGEMRTDVRDARDRVLKLEVKVDHLPSKTWIGSVVLGGMAVLTALFAFLSHLGLMK